MRWRKWGRPAGAEQYYSLTPTSFYFFYYLSSTQSVHVTAPPLSPQFFDLSRDVKVNFSTYGAANRDWCLNPHALCVRALILCLLHYFCSRYCPPLSLSDITNAWTSRRQDCEYKSLVTCFCLIHFSKLLDLPTSQKRDMRSVQICQTVTLHMGGWPIRVLQVFGLSKSVEGWRKERPHLNPLMHESFSS